MDVGDARRVDVGDARRANWGTRAAVMAAQVLGRGERPVHPVQVRRASLERALRSRLRGYGGGVDRA
ncbi:hypothetical protein BE17_08110 [Sorangium cellulosum]|uniref:Uncharacterized protein n=1 Tax=Sorangium cellulosum TaxID=56 RepID=A0A150R1J4_SORCE|nr:hypothetical protein BE17_08110 [Sorangium cellulosum]